MVIELQVTPPILNGKKIYPEALANGDASQYYRAQLAIMKENLLNPVEVKFRVQENGVHGDKRKRLTTISSEISDIESVSSTKEKKKIPVSLIMTLQCRVCLFIFIKWPP